ncbi:MAG: hypothetical protein ACI9WU_002858 [Myxococcota bacterium]|jgi:hypothetical protein
MLEILIARCCVPSSRSGPDYAWAPGESEGRSPEHAKAPLPKVSAAEANTVAGTLEAAEGGAVKPARVFRASWAAPRSAKAAGAVMVVFT